MKISINEANALKVARKEARKKIAYAEERGYTKTCDRCRRCLLIKYKVTYCMNSNPKVSPDGLQIFCRECDARRQATEVGYGWTTFMRTIKKERIEHLWSQKEYNALVERDLCYWCCARLSDWGKGHHIDRINSRRGHVVDNCVACCAACNWSKGSQNAESWLARTLRPLLDTYGKGKIPWEIINDKGPKHVNIPNLSEYEVIRQLDLWNETQNTHSLPSGRQPRSGRCEMGVALQDTPA